VIDSPCIVESLFTIPCSIEEVNRVIFCSDNFRSEDTSGLCSFAVKQAASTMSLRQCLFHYLQFSAFLLFFALCDFQLFVIVFIKSIEFKELCISTKGDSFHIQNNGPISLMPILKKYLKI